MSLTELKQVIKGNPRINELHIWQDLRLSPLQKQLLIKINRCFRSDLDFPGGIGCSQVPHKELQKWLVNDRNNPMLADKKTIERNLLKLERWGVLGIYRSLRPGTKEKDTNKYVINPHSSWNIDKTRKKTEGRDTEKGRDKKSLGVGAKSQKSGGELFLKNRILKIKFKKESSSSVVTQELLESLKATLREELKAELLQELGRGIVEKGRGKTTKVREEIDDNLKFLIPLAQRLGIRNITNQNLERFIEYSKDQIQELTPAVLDLVLANIKEEITITDPFGLFKSIVSKISGKKEVLDRNEGTTKIIEVPEDQLPSSEAEENRALSSCEHLKVWEQVINHVQKEKLEGWRFINIFSTGLILKESGKLWDKLKIKILAAVATEKRKKIIRATLTQAWKAITGQRAALDLVIE